MRLVPTHVDRWHSAAERKIHKKLESSSLDDSYISFHSLNLSEHRYKEWGEADFVIIGPEGVLVLEVKGGRVAYREGRWIFTDRYEREHSSSEGPFVQAKEARYALENWLSGNVKPEILRRCVFGWGVVFPDVKFDAKSVEYDNALVFDAAGYDRDGFDDWIKRLYLFWREKANGETRLEGSDVKSISSLMRPEFDLVPAFLSRLATSYESVLRLTDQQYKYLDILLAQRHNVVEGGAGTGKTFLAIEAARRLAQSEEKVLFTCRSPVLASAIRNRLSNTSVAVMDYMQLWGLRKNRDLPQFDIVVVDEGQDLLDMDAIEILDLTVKGGLDQGSWLFFMDKNNQASMYESLDMDALDYLRSAGHPFPLTDNCRNTNEIIKHTSLYTGADIGKPWSDIPGVPVDDRFSYEDQGQLVNEIENKLSEWIDEEGVKPSDIAILSPSSLDHSAAGKLGKRWRRRLVNVDEAVGMDWPESSIPFSTIKNFKGLENRLVMLIDLEHILTDELDIKLLYIGMTRANAYLWLPIPEKMKKQFVKLIKKNAKTGSPD